MTDGKMSQKAKSYSRWRQVDTRYHQFKSIMVNCLIFVQMQIPKTFAELLQIVFTDEVTWKLLLALLIMIIKTQVDDEDDVQTVAFVVHRTRTPKNDSCRKEFGISQNRA